MKHLKNDNSPIFDLGCKLMALIAATLSVQIPSAFAGAQEAKEAWNRKDYATAYAEYKKLAEAGEEKANLVLARMHREGLGVEKDPVEASRWFAKAFQSLKIQAEGGDHNAMRNLGWIYDYRHPYAKDFTYIGAAIKSDHPDYKTAEYWYRKGYAADKINGINLADFYCPQTQSINGSVSQSSAYIYPNVARKCDAETISFLAESAKRGSYQAMIITGNAYRYGFAVQKDFKEAEKWFQMAAKTDNPRGDNRAAQLALNELQNAIKEETAMQVAESAHQEAARAKLARDAKLMKSIGTQVCKSGSSREREGSTPSTILIQGFIEAVSAERIKVSISGMRSRSAFGGSTYETRLENLDYKGNQLKLGSLLWDDAEAWEPC